MEIISKTPIETTSAFGVFLSLISAILIVLLFTYIAKKKNIPSYIFMAIIPGMIIEIIILIVFTSNTGSYEYEVQFNDSITFQEVVNKYKIVEEKENDIWVIEDRWVKK